MSRVVEIQKTGTFVNWEWENARRIVVDTDWCILKKGVRWKGGGAALNLASKHFGGTSEVSVLVDCGK